MGQRSQTGQTRAELPRARARATRATDRVRLVWARITTTMRPLITHRPLLTLILVAANLSLLGAAIESREPDANWLSRRVHLLDYSVRNALANELKSSPITVCALAHEPADIEEIAAGFDCAD